MNKPIVSEVEQIVANQLAIHEVEKTDDGYLFVDRGDITTLKFLPRDEVIDQLHLVSIAEIDSVFNPENIPKYGLEHIQWLNSRSAYGAFYLQDGSLHLKAQFSIYVEEPAAQMVAFIILEAFGKQQSFGVSEVLSRVSEEHFKQNRGVLGSIRTWKNPIPLEEFQTAAELFNNNGCVSTAAEGGFMLEVPLSGDIPTRMMDISAQTALLRVTTNIPHPILGAGYLTTIALPISPAKSEIVEVANTLNRLEFQQGDFVPRFGAWSVRLLGGDLVYSSFLQISERYGDLHQTIMNWSIQRTLWLRENYWDPERGVVITNGLKNEAIK